jgi:hypothetical protein
MGRIILTDDGITLYDSGVASSTPASPLAPPGNITDVLFHRPEPAAPSAPTVPSGSGPYPVNPGTVDFAADAGKNFALLGVTSVTMVVPEGWAGVVLMNTIQAIVPAVTVTPYTTAVNGANQKTVTVATGSNNYELRFGGSAQGDWEIALPNGPVTLGIQQNPSSAVIFGFHPSPA